MSKWRHCAETLSVFKLRGETCADIPPDELLVVQGLGRLPAQDVHLPLEDRELHLPFHVLLGLGDAVADELTLGAVPKT